MLFDRAINGLTFRDVEDFCHRFEEGWRVEYKRSFDEAKAKIPQVVSSFANSNGGVLILGVEAKQGKPLFPIRGFPKPDREEIRLSIQNMCMDGIYPPLHPEIIDISTDDPGKIVVVINVEESVEAPHAVENSEKVYVRSGDSNRWYKLSDITMIERLLERRNRPLSLKDKFSADADERFKRETTFWTKPDLFLGVRLTPTFPKAPLIGLAELYDLMTTQIPRYPGIGTFIFAPYDWRRINGGLFRAGENFFLQVNDYGVINLYYVPILQPVYDRANDPKASKHIYLQTVLEFVAVAIRYAAFFYNRCTYWGDIEAELSSYNARGVPVVFSGSSKEVIPPNISFDPIVKAINQYPSEELSGVVEVASDILSRFFWAFNRQENYGPERLKPFVQEMIKNFNILAS